MEKVIIQQGDLELVKVNNIPQSAKKLSINGNSFIVLRGEGTNTHELKKTTLCDDVEVYQEGDTLYLNVKKDTNLVHEEHGTTIVRKGIYKRRIEREFDYEQMEARNTQD